MGMPNQRSAITSTRVIASTGVASTITRLVAYIAQTKSGRRSHLMPGARKVCVVAMKLTPVSTEENPTTNTPIAAVSTAELENIVE